MWWSGAVFAASGPGGLSVINGTMILLSTKKILKDNVRPSVRDLKLKRTWVLIQNTPANPPLNGWRKTKWRLWSGLVKVLTWNPIEMLWHDLKRRFMLETLHVAELLQFCQDEWAKIPPQRCNRLIASYHKRLMAVVAAKGAQPVIRFRGAALFTQGHVGFGLLFSLHKKKTSLKNCMLCVLVLSLINI